MAFRVRLDFAQFSELTEEGHDQGKKFTLAERLRGNSKATASDFDPMNPRNDSLHPLHLTFHFDSEARKDFNPLGSPIPHQTGILETRLCLSRDKAGHPKVQEEGRVLEAEVARIHPGHGGQQPDPASPEQGFPPAMPVSICW